MISQADIQRVLEEDLTGYKRDVLEFNHRWLAKGALDYLKTSEHYASERFRNLQHLVDVGAHVSALLKQAQRTGRKTVRIDDLLAEAEKNLIDTSAKLSDAASVALRILDDTPADVEAALEALPDGSVVKVSDEATADRECAVFVATHAFGRRTWEGSGAHGTFATSYLARNCAPLTVIA